MKTYPSEPDAYRRVEVFSFQLEGAGFPPFPRSLLAQQGTGRRGPLELRG